MRRRTTHGRIALLAVIAMVSGGRAGIRTREPLAGPAVFKTVAFVRSATLPNGV